MSRDVFVRMTINAEAEREGVSFPPEVLDQTLAAVPNVSLKHEVSLRLIDLPGIESALAEKMVSYSLDPIEMMFPSDGISPSILIEPAARIPGATFLGSAITREAILEYVDMAGEEWLGAANRIARPMARHASFHGHHGSCTCPLRTVPAGEGRWFKSNIGRRYSGLAFTGDEAIEPMSFLQFMKEPQMNGQLYNQNGFYGPKLGARTMDFMHLMNRQLEHDLFGKPLEITDQTVEPVDY